MSRLQTAISAFCAITTLTLTAGAMNASADFGVKQTELLTQEAVLEEGGSTMVQLPGWSFVDKVDVQLEAKEDASIELVANGEPKGQFSAQGGTVTIGEVVGSLQFRHTHGHGRARIRSVMVYTRGNCLAGFERNFAGGYLGGSNFPVPTYTGGFETSPGLLAARNESSRLALESIRLVDSMLNHVRLGDFKDFLLPIKIVAGRLYSVSAVRHDTSQLVFQNLQALAAQIQLANDYITAEMSRNDIFDDMVALMTIFNQIVAISQ